MIQRAWPFAISSAACLLLSLTLIPAATAQGPGRVAPSTQMTPQIPVFGTPAASVTVTAADEDGVDLGEQALVKLVSNMTGTNLWATTQDRSQAMFDDVPSGVEYEVEVSAAGYETTTSQVYVMAPSENYDVIVRLKRDASSAAVATLPGQVLGGKERREAQKAIAALTAGKLKAAEKDLAKAYKADPGNADVNYLFGVLYTRENNTSEAETYLTRAVTINKHHVRALTMLGELQLRQKNYQGAIASLEQAASSDKGFWIAHWLLASAYLKSGAFEKSVQQSEQAIQAGKGAGTPAELIRGQALASLGKIEEAIQAFQNFLQQDPHSTSAEAVRKVIAQLKGADSPKYQEVSTSRETVVPVSVLPTAILTNLADGGMSIPTWHPPTVDDEKLSLAQGAVCPANKVIAGAARSAEHLVDSISKFEATEDVIDQQLNVLGKPETTAGRKFDYMASISESKNGLAVDETRQSFSDQGDFPDHIATRGLVALALVFHPALRDDYAMTCEGLGQWKGRATWLVYFRQRSDRPNRFLSYEFTNGSYAVALKGRAWIAADNFHIVHLETDLLAPMRQIQLLSQHQSVDYGAVYFPKRKTQLWLPKNAEIYFEFRRHRYYRRDSFGNFKLFAVSTTEKIGQPNIPSTADQTQRPHQ